MKISISKKAFVDVLSDVEKCVSKNDVIPSTGCVLIQTDQEGISVITTDTTKGIKVFVPCKVDKEGSVLVPFRKIIGVVKELSSNDDIVLNATEQRVSLISGSSKFNIATLNVNDFPKIDFECKDGITFTMKGDDIRKIGQYVGVTISNDLTVPMLQGIGVFVQDGKVRSYSTDKKRLSEFVCSYEGEQSLEHSVIATVDAFTSISAVIDDMQSNIKVSTNYGTIFFQSDNKVVWSRMFEGSYPDISGKIPKHNHCLSFNRGDLYGAMKQIVPFITDDVFGITIAVKKDKAVISIKNAGGDAEVTIDVVQTGGDEFTASVNCDFMLAFVRACQGENVILKVNEARSGIVCQSSGEEGWTSVIMPLVI